MATTTQLFQRKHKALIKRLHFILNEKGWTQRDLALKTGLRDSTVSRIMHGEANLTLKTITLLEHSLGEQLIVIT